MPRSHVTALGRHLPPMAAFVGAAALGGCVLQSPPAAYSYTYSYPTPYYSSYTVSTTYPNGYTAAYSPDYNGSYNTYGKTAGGGG